MFDKMYGVPGLNGLIRSRLLDFIRRQAKSKTYFSNTTYSIIYKLINDSKILVFFLPSFSSNKFLSDGNPLQVIGGYDFDNRKIQIIVKWSFGLNALNSLFESYLPLICNKIFALILSEALLIYDYKHNGEISKSNSIKQWYKIYFGKSMGDILHRQSLTEELTDKISENYGARLFERVEKALIEGRSPSIKFEHKGENAELDIEGIPSIKKGKKELEDIFGDAIEDYVNEIMANNRLQVDAAAYQNLKQIWSDFAELGAFVYTHRDLPLDPSNIEAMPEDLEDSVTSKQDPMAIAIAKAKAKEEEKAEEDQAYQKYLAANPKLKALIDKTADEQYDKKVQKYFHDFLPYDGSMTKTPDGRMIPEHVGKYSDKTSFIDPKSGESYISLFIIGKPCSLNDARIALNGTKRAQQLMLDSETRLNNLRSNGASAEQLEAAFEAYKNAKAQADLLARDFIKLAASLTANTPNAFKFYQPQQPALPFDRNVKPKDKPQEQPKAKLDSTEFNQQLIDFEKLINEEAAIQDANKKHLALGIGSSRLDRVILQQQLEVSRLSDDLGRQISLLSSDPKKQNRPQDIQSAKNIALALTARMQQDKKAWNILSNSQIDQQINTQLKTNPQFLNLPQTFLNPDFDKQTADSYDSRIDPHSKGPIQLDKIEDDINYMNKLTSSIVDDIRNSRMGDPNSQDNNTLKLKALAVEQHQRFIARKLNSYESIKNDLINKQQEIDNIKLKIKQERDPKKRLQLKTDRDIALYEYDQLERTRIATWSQIEHDYDQCRKNTRDMKNALLDYTKHQLSFIRTKNFQNIRTFMQDHLQGQYQQRKSDIGDRGAITLFNRNINKAIEILQDPNASDANIISALRIIKSEGDRYPALYKALELDPHVLHVLETDRSIDSKEGYARDLFLNGLGFLYNSLPSWNTIKYYFNQGMIKGQQIIRTVKSIYRYAKVILPLKSNIMPYVNQKFGFGQIANFNYFDLAYKLTYKLKKMYELRKGTVRQNMVYSELYLPVSILQKVLYAHLVTQNDFTPEILYLINCSNKGLEEFL